MGKKTKTFDCVEMKRRGADLVLRSIGDSTPEQELKFWREGTAELRRRQKLLIKQRQRLEKDIS